MYTVVIRLTSNQKKYYYDNVDFFYENGTSQELVVLRDMKLHRIPYSKVDMIEITYEA